MGTTPIRTGIQSNYDIQRALLESIAEVDNWIQDQPDALFTTGPAGRWTSGQHLEHLIRTIEPIATGLSLPKLVVRFVLGTSDRPSDTYAGVATRYEGVLDGGGKAAGRFVPPPVALARKAPLLAKHRAVGTTIATRLNARWNEIDLDRYAAKHPLLGKMSLREILYFTIHHHDHHLNTLKRDYGSA